MYDGVNDQSCILPEFHNKNTLHDNTRILKWCGVNDHKNYSHLWAERYTEICKLGKENGFAVIVIIQPNVDLQGKILTSQELNAYFERPQSATMLHQYGEAAQTVVDETQGCYSVLDFTRSLDNYDYPLYFDYHHLEKLGNQIIAEKISDVVIPYLLENDIFNDMPNDLKKVETFEYEFGQDLQNSNFVGKNLENKSFFGDDLQGSSFHRAILTNADFRLANLENVDFSNSKIDNVQLRQNSLKNADFMNVDFTNVDITNVDFSYSTLHNVDLSNKDLQHTFFYKADLTGANMTKAVLNNNFFHDATLSNIDFDWSILTGIKFSEINNKSLVGVSVEGAAITYSDLRDVDLTGLDFSYINFGYSNLSGLDLTTNNFYGTILIKTNLSHSNLSGVDLSPKDMEFVTVFSDKAHLIELKNQMFGQKKIKNELWPFEPNRYLIDAEVGTNGTDLMVKYFIFTDASGADFTGAKFQNANLQTVMFRDSDLTNADFTNADLSGADLTSTNLSGADLTNANLLHAMLTNANLSGATLNCIGHDICNPP